MTHTSSRPDATFETVVEIYLRGIVEYWGTMHHFFLYATPNITGEMLIPLSGTMHVTIGWIYQVTLSLSARPHIDYYGFDDRPVYLADQPTDPSDLLHDILVSGSGGLSQALVRARSDRDLTDYESLQVHLGVRDDGMAVLMGEDPGEVDEWKGNLTPSEESSIVENVQPTSSKVQVAATSGSEDPIHVLHSSAGPVDEECGITDGVMHVAHGTR
ncbi:hypothetical protein PAXINDRAFT_18370 [Paxillus involutus ATCC 200175]|uniref:Uncharacterized protein n=1 Tax=Paxillus involutus ATCC 200175 TaxID=664439 RepID=A0A0C9TMJ8_PAXIN|nr:hypothetical protein PAXINDRAFT_18370 [Paxillus involutus ATCC 200175]